MFLLPLLLRIFLCNKPTIEGNKGVAGIVVVVVAAAVT